MLWPTRLSFLSFLFPRRFIDTDAAKWLDLHEWSATEYKWTQDKWNGLQDTIAPVSETIRTGRGDCDDYAVVSASWLLKNAADGGGADVEFGYLFSTAQGVPLPEHMVAYADNTVYSSGEILTDTTKEAYVRESEYDVAVWRTV